MRRDAFQARNPSRHPLTLSETKDRQLSLLLSPALLHDPQLDVLLLQVEESLGESDVLMVVRGHVGQSVP